MAYSGVWETLKNPNFEEVSIFEGCDGSRMPKMHSGEVSNIFEKFLNFFQFFTTPWPFSARILKCLVKINPKWPNLMYRKPWKCKLLQNIIFESCDGSIMTKMHPRRVWIFLVDIFELNMIPKWHLAYWKHWKKKLNLEESYLMTCGCPKCLMKKVRTCLKHNIKKNIILSTLAMCFLLEKF